MSEDNNKIIEGIPKTENYKLLKPRPDDFVDINHINYNADYIDKNLKINADAIINNKNDMESAQSSINNLNAKMETKEDKVKVTQVEGIANKGIADARKAQEKADLAYTSANEGKVAAQTAQTRAEQAFNKGIDAHNAAKTAESKAVNAETTADAAIRDARTAEIRAEKAYISAESAINTANAAKAKADTVQSNLNTTNGNVSRNSSSISSLTSTKFNKGGGRIDGDTTINGDLTIPVGKKIVFMDTGNTAAAAISTNGEDLIITEPEDNNREWARFKDDVGLYILGSKVWTESSFNPSSKANTTEFNTVKSTASQAKTTANSALAKAEQAFQLASEGKKSLGSALAGVGVQGIPTSSELPNRTFSWFSEIIRHNTKVFRQAKEQGDFYVSGFGFTPKVVVAKTYCKIKTTEFIDIFIDDPHDPRDPRERDPYEYDNDPRMPIEERIMAGEKELDGPERIPPRIIETYRSEYSHYVYCSNNLGGSIFEFRGSGSTVTARSNSTSTPYYVTSGKMKFGDLPHLLNNRTPRGGINEQIVECYIDYTIIG